MKKKFAIKKVYHELLEKVANSRFSKDFWTYREEITARDGKTKETNVSFRSELDTMSENELKRTKQLIEECSRKEESLKIHQNINKKWTLGVLI